MPKTRFLSHSWLSVGIALQLLALTPTVAKAQEGTPGAERPIDVVARVIRSADSTGVLDARVLGERHYLIARSRDGQADRSVLKIDVARRDAGGLRITCLVTDRLDSPPARQERMVYEIATDGAVQRLEVTRTRGAIRYQITGHRLSNGTFRVDAERRVGTEGEIESAEIPADEVSQRLPWPLVRFVLPLLVDQGLPERLSLFETETFSEGSAVQLSTGPHRGSVWSLELTPEAGAAGSSMNFRVDLTGERGSVSIRVNAVLEGPAMHQGGGTLIKRISKRSHDAMIEDAAATDRAR